ncbi:MAG: aminopeptidase P N-terminal domain-containing protein [Candidatus Aminicenantales bacterium]
MSKIPKRLLVAALCFWAAAACAKALSPPLSEYAARRARLMERIPDGAALFLGAHMPFSDRQFFQGNDFYYFTGVEVPDAILVIDGMRKESVLFFSLTEEEARSEGIPLGLVYNPHEATGIERVFPRERFSSYLASLSARTKTLYTMFRPEELMRENTNEKFRLFQNAITMNLWDGRLTRELQLVRKLREKFPHIQVKDCSGMVWDLRKIKSPAEIELLRKAARIGVKAHVALMESTRPGVSERELAALFEYICQKEGAQDLAFYVILMSDENHRYGHYHKHDRILKDGDFVILDAGPDFGYYNADISSSFPVSGTFTPRQKEVYSLALGVRTVCLQNYRPGLTLRQVGERVRGYLQSQGYDPEDRKFRGWVRYGGYNHSIGMATHDPMGTPLGPDEILKPGFVFACDINFPLPEEKMGIRLEDTVLITQNGCEILSRGVPRTIEEVEAAMKRPGIIDLLKKNKKY